MSSRVLWDWLDCILLTSVIGYLIFIKYPSPEIRINIILLLITALLFEKYYVKRSSVLPNILVIYFMFSEKFDLLPSILRNYFDFGILIGIFLILALIKKISVPSAIYNITYMLYGMKTILGFYLTFLLLGPTFNDTFWFVLLGLTVVVWWVGVYRFGNKSPFDF